MTNLRLQKLEDSERARLVAALDAAHRSRHPGDLAALIMERIEAVKQTPGYVPGPGFGSLEEVAAALRASLAEPRPLPTIAELRAQLAEITSWLAARRAAEMMPDESK